MLVNKKTLSEIIGYSERTLTEWQKDPSFPIAKDGERGQSNNYDVSQVINWYVRKQVADSGVEKPRDRKDRLSADMLELEMAEKIGGLVLANDVKQQITALVIAVRTEILNGNHKLKTELDAMYGFDTDIELLDEHSRSVLNTLSGYQPVVDQGGDECDDEIQAA